MNDMGLEAEMPTDRVRSGFLRLPISLAVLVFLLALASIYFTRETGRVAAIWPTNALILVALLRSPRNLWSGLLGAGLLGTLAANFVVGDSIETALQLAACNGLEVSLAAWFVRRFAGGDIDLSQQKHLIFFLLAAAVAPLVSGAPAGLTLSAKHHATYLASLKGWYAADALGLLVATPVILALTPQTLRALGQALGRQRSWISILVFLASLGVVFGQNRMPLFFLIPPALILLAFELSVAGAAFGLLAIALSGVVMTVAGYGGLTVFRTSITARLEWLQVFTAIMTVTTLPVATALATRQRLEAKLRETNQLSSLAQQVGRIGFWRNDLRTAQRTWSDEVFEIHGLLREEFGPDPFRALELYRPQDRAILTKTLQHSAKTGEPFNFTVRFERADDGRECVVTYQGEVEHDHKGQACALVGVVRDVTEEETARQRIAESEARYRLLADSSTDVVIKVDRNDVIEYISPAVKRYGYDAQALIGVSASALVHADDVPRLKALIAELFTTGQVDRKRDSSYRLRTADGEYVWMEGSPTILCDEAGGPVAVISQLRDITERRLALEALADSEARYRIIAENVTDIVSRLGLDGATRYVSPSAAIVTGHCGQEHDGHQPSARIHPDDLKLVRQQYRDMVEGTLPDRAHATYRTRHKEGHWIWLEVTIALVRDTAGRPLEFISVGRDVTERVRLEQDLRAARRAAEDAAAVKASFLANMSHEIRTPVTSILGFTELLSGERALKGAARDHVARISGAGRALLSVVNDVLDFSKLEAGQFEIAPTTTVPGDVLCDALLMFTPQAEAKGLSLEFEADDLPGCVLIDPDRVRQVLLNLIGNAIKFTDHGHVRLVADYDHRKKRLSVRVEDTGAGISKAQQKKLFQRYSQVDASAARRGGTGLGLAISKGLIEAMGGKIGVESKPGEGSVFYFQIDAPAIDVPGDGKTQDAEVSLGLAGVRVLVTDDNSMNRDLARAVLEPFGAEVVDAQDGPGAVEIAASRAFDVILMDVRMPGLDGPGALRLLRSQPGPNQRTPVLAFTADADIDGLGLAHGFNGIVRKPVVALDLVQMIHSAADGLSKAGAATKRAAATR